MKLLREWRALTDGAGVPALAHGNDLVVGFSAERYEQLLDCCAHTSDVDADEIEARLAGEGAGGG